MLPQIIGTTDSGEYLWQGFEVEGTYGKTWISTGRGHWLLVMHQDRLHLLEFWLHEFEDTYTVNYTESHNYCAVIVDQTVPHTIAELVEKQIKDATEEKTYSNSRD